MTTIADRVREAGIVGAGGAGFPTHVKFAARADTVIANGAECEPLLQCDKAVMRLRTEEVLTGLARLAGAVGAERQVIALKGHYPDVVARVRKVAAEQFPAVEVYQLDNYYPAGDEQVLVEEVTGRVVPEGGIPLEVGCVVNNVITLSQVARAVDAGQPVTSRALTVAGAVPRRLTCELPIGTPLRHAVERAGGATVESWAIIEGGPMMGEVVDPDRPVTKRTSGVIVLPADHPLVLRKRAPAAREAQLARIVCCQCRMCTDLCPRYNLGHDLEPHLAMRTLGTEGLIDAPTAHVTAAYLCCLCGVCEVYACPLSLSPRRVYGELRAALARAGQKNPHRRADCQPLEQHKARRIPLPRLVARLGLTEYLAATDLVELEPAPVDAVRIPLHQHTGAPARPMVAVGDRVAAGAVIGEIPEGKLGARVHASIPGTVVEVSEHEIEIQRT